MSVQGAILIITIFEVSKSWEKSHGTFCSHLLKCWTSVGNLLLLSEIWTRVTNDYHTTCQKMFKHSYMSVFQTGKFVPCGGFLPHAFWTLVKSLYSGLEELPCAFCKLSSLVRLKQAEHGYMSILNMYPISVNCIYNILYIQ